MTFFLSNWLLDLYLLSHGEEHGKMQTLCSINNSFKANLKQVQYLSWFWAWSFRQFWSLLSMKSKPWLWIAVSLGSSSSPDSTPSFDSTLICSCGKEFGDFTITSLTELGSLHSVRIWVAQLSFLFWGLIKQQWHRQWAWASIDPSFTLVSQLTFPPRQVIRTNGGWLMFSLQCQWI